MRYKPIDASFFKDNRENFAREMTSDSIAVFHSNDLMPRTADQVFPFRQNSDLFYLTGIDQEETILILYPDAPDPAEREILFLRETNEEIATWEGERLTKTKARKLAGIQNIQWNDAYRDVLDKLMYSAVSCYVHFNEHERYEHVVPYRNLREARKLKEAFPGHNFKRSAPVLRRLRAVKRPEEIEQMKRACAITGETFNRVLKFVHPGVMEYEIEAEITHEFIRNGAGGHAYDPIVASGSNACVLHYIQNEQKCRDRELILFDFGCTYGNYASDLSRTIPVNGRFTKRQKEVYNTVYRVFKQAREMLRPGVLLDDYQKEVGKLIEKELVDLKVLSVNDIKKQDPDQPLYKKYFPHGTSHHIGLDVHDVPFRHEPIKEGMTFTCEPGIYIREEGIGVRIENDIQVTRDGFIDLMKDIPVEVEEIEEIMNSGNGN